MCGLLQKCWPFLHHVSQNSFSHVDNLENCHGYLVNISQKALLCKNAAQIPFLHTLAISQDFHLCTTLHDQVLDRWTPWALFLQHPTSSATLLWSRTGGKCFRKPNIASDTPAAHAPEYRGIVPSPKQTNTKKATLSAATQHASPLYVHLSMSTPLFVSTLPDYLLLQSRENIKHTTQLSSAHLINSTQLSQLISCWVKE